MVPKLYSRRVEGNSAGFFGDLLDLAGRGEQEFGLVVNEARDQPRAGHAVYMDV
jgi:hypothetical protein